MLNKLKSFLKNTTGSIVPTFALLVIPMTIVVGAAVDYTRYSNHVNELQTSVDAAGIAAASELPNIIAAAGDRTGDELKQFVNAEIQAYADSFMQANIQSEDLKDSYTFKAEYIPATREKDGGLTITASLTYDTIFGGINGENGGPFLFQDKLELDIASEFRLGNKTLEIALVMDNSGSMAFRSGDLSSQSVPAPKNQRRITLLKSAANDLVDSFQSVAANATSPKPVQFSVVPFATTVNVGPLDHENHSDGNLFIDRFGVTGTHNEHFDWKNSWVPFEPDQQLVHFGENERVALRGHSSDYNFLFNPGRASLALQRFSLFRMLNTKWEGCVEMRPYPHNVQDTYIANNRTLNARGRTTLDELFVPYFVPDEPDPVYYDFYSDALGRIETVVEDYWGSRDPRYEIYQNNYLPDFLTYNAETGLAEPRFLRDNLFNSDINRFSADETGNNRLSRTNWVAKYQAFQGLDRQKINQINTGSGSSLRDRQLKAILQDVKIPSFEKNLNATNGDYFRDYGPNAFCPDVPVLQLTENFDEVKETIDDMEAHGGTNIQMGLMWGWRTLSEAKPFSGGRPLSDPENIKIIILLTDGNNQKIFDNNPNNSRYSAWGYMRPEGLLPNPVTGEDTHRRLMEGTGIAERQGTIYESKFNLPSNPRNTDDYADIMNLHTNQACNNIKNDGISIYTIAFDVAPGGKVKELLEDCAGSGRVRQNNEIVEVLPNDLKYYHDVQGVELEDTFAQIATSINSIRITK